MFITAEPAESQSPREILATAFRQVIAEHLRLHALGTNVDRATLLASDYLNHFNEIVVLLEHAPANLGEMTAALEAWKPISYVEYFSKSDVRERDIAIVAYRNAPENVRTMFDAAIAALQLHMMATVKEIRTLAKRKRSKALDSACAESAARLKTMIAQAASIATGHNEVLPIERASLLPSLQERVDVLFAA